MDVNGRCVQTVDWQAWGDSYDYREGRVAGRTTALQPHPQSRSRSGGGVAGGSRNEESLERDEIGRGLSYTHTPTHTHTRTHTHTPLRRDSDAVELPPILGYCSTEFTGFTGTKVQILTQKLEPGPRAHTTVCMIVLHSPRALRLHRTLLSFSTPSLLGRTPWCIKLESWDTGNGRSS